MMYAIRFSDATGKQRTWLRSGNLAFRSLSAAIRWASDYATDYHESLQITESVNGIYGSPVGYVDWSGWQRYTATYRPGAPYADPNPYDGYNER